MLLNQERCTVSKDAAQDYLYLLFGENVFGHYLKLRFPPKNLEISLLAPDYHTLNYTWFICSHRKRDSA